MWQRQQANMDDEAQEDELAGLAPAK